MTQDNSIKNKTPFFTKEMLHNGKSVLRENLRLFIVILVLHMAALPLLLSNIILSLHIKGTADPDMYVVIAVLTTGAAAAAGLICALSAMPYLYKKSVVDMRLSLPMTTGQRFVSDFLGGAFLYFVPFLISQVFTWVLMLIGHITCDGRVFIPKDYRYDSGSSYSYNGFECHIFEQSAPFLIKSVIGALAIMLMYYTLTVLVSSCCGAIFESAAYSILANLLIPGVIATLIFVFTGQVKGLEPTFYIYRILPYCSPAGGAFGLFASMENLYYPEEIEGSKLYTGVYFSKWLVLFLIVTAVMIAAAYLIYRKRKAEDTGKPVVFGVFYHILMTLILVEINCAFTADNGLDADMLMPQIITTAIIYLIFHVVNNRGFAHFKKGVLSYIITMAVTVGAIAVVDETEMFGAGEYVPSADSVSAVYTSYNGYFESPYSMNDGTMEKMSKITDTDNIRIITEAHSLVKDIDSGTDESFYNSQGDVFHVLYKMKSGRVILRKYQLYDDVRELLSTMDCTEEFKQVRLDAINSQIDESAKALEYTVKNETHNDCYASLYPQWVYNNSSYISGISVDVKRLPNDFYERLKESFTADILAETEDEYFTREGDIWYFEDTLGTKGTRGYGIPVKEHYTNTLEYLKSMGFSPLPKITEENVERLLDNYSITMSDSAVQEQLTGKAHITSTVTYAKDVRADIIDKTLYDAHKGEVMEMMSYAKKEYRAEDSRYTIRVNGNCAAIPAEYTEKAKELYISIAVQNFIQNMYDYGYDRYLYKYDLDYDSYTAPYDEYYGDTDSYKYNVERYQKYIKAFLEVYSEEELCEVFGDEAGTAVYESMTAYADARV